MKPSAEHPEHIWIVTEAGMRKLTSFQDLMSTRSPDNMGMYTFNDHYGYGIVELVENLMLDFDEEKDWKAQWAICEAVGFALLHWVTEPMCQYVDFVLLFHPPIEL